MASWATLATTTVYTTQLQTINDRDVDVSKMLDPAFVTVTSPLTNMVRWNSANKRFETYNGSSWVELIVAATDAYNHTVTGVRGGNLYGTITNNGTISGGTVNATTLQVAGSAAWTVASLTSNSQLTNGANYITAASLSTYAPLASPPLTGTPTAPTQALNDNSTKIATTAWVIGQSYMSASSVAAGYAPLGGGGTSGIWPISVTGNSVTTSQTAFTTLSVSGAGSVAGAFSSGLQLNATGSQASVIGTATGALGGIMVQGNGTNAAFMAFHRPGSYAAYLGIDTDNVWKVGGWSMGANAYPILHSANYNSYAPTLSGTGATGTWNINISGNASNATNLSGGSVAATTLTASTGTFSGLIKGNGGGSGLGAITVSSSAPSGGADGDLWFQV